MTPQPSSESWAKLHNLLDNYYHERYMSEERGKGHMKRAQDSLDFFIKEVYLHSHTLGKEEGSRGDYGRKMFQQGHKEGKEEGYREALESLPEKRKKTDDNQDVSTTLDVIIDIGDAGFNQALAQAKENIKELIK